MLTYEQFKAQEFNIIEEGSVLEKELHLKLHGVTLEEDLEAMSKIAYRIYSTDKAARPEGE